MFWPSIVFLTIIVIPSSSIYLGSRRTCSISLAFSFGIVVVFAYFGLLAALGRYFPIPFNPPVTFLGLAAISGIIFFIAPETETRRNLSYRINIYLSTMLTFVVAVHFKIWNRMLTNYAVIPNHDVYIHTNWVGNMARLHSLSSVAAYTNPISGSGSAAPFYPFSLHAFCAFIVQTGASTPTLTVVAVTRILVCILLPLGLFSLAKSAGLSKSYGAIGAAAASIPLYNFPYQTLGWGGVAMVAGVILLIHAAALVIASSAWKNSLRLLIIPLSFIALATVHTSEAFALPIFCLILGFPTLRKSKHARLYLSIFCSLAMFTAVYPFIDSQWVHSLVSNIGTIDPHGTGTFYQAVGLIVMLTPGLEFHSVWVPILIAAGVFSATIKSGNSRFLGMYLTIGAGALVTSQFAYNPWSWMSRMFDPWYRQFDRITYLLVPVVALLGGLAFDVLGKFIRVRQFSRKFMAPSVAVAAVVAMTSLMIFSSIGRTSQIAQLLVDTYSMQTRRTLDAPLEVPELRARETNVLASFDSGIGYWTADYNVKTYAAPQLGDAQISQREELLDTIVNFATSEKARKQVESLGITHLATNDRAMSGPPRPNSIDVTRAGNFTSIWSQDGITVWKIKPVVAGFAGKFSDWFTTSKDTSHRWLLEDSLRLGIHNLSQSTHTAEIKFVINQNPCKSASGISLSNGDRYLFNSADSRTVIIQTELLPHEDKKLSITYQGRKCLDKATGMLLRVAITSLPIEISR